MSSLRKYEHSGRCGGLAIPLGLVNGIAAAIVLAFVYQWFQDVVPFVYLNAIATLIFAIGIGLGVGLGMKKGKCRNLAIAMSVGLLCGIVGEVASYHFSYNRGTRDIAQELQAEGMEITASEVRAQTGYLGYYQLLAEMGITIGRSSGGSGTTISGWGMYGLWILEALIVLGVSAIGANILLKDPFCEDCGEWTVSEKLKPLQNVNVEALGESANKGDLQGLLHPAASDQYTNELTYEVHGCPSCEKTAYVTLTLEWPEQVKKNKVEKKSLTIGEHTHVSPEDLESLKQHASTYQPAQAAEPGDPDLADSESDKPASEV